MRALAILPLLLCSCSAKMGREWYETGSPKSLYASVDLGRDVDAEYVSAASSQTIGQNESTSVKTISTAGVSWKGLDVYGDVEKGKQATDRTVVTEGARTDRTSITEGAKTARQADNNATKVALEGLAQ